MSYPDGCFAHYVVKNKTTHYYTHADVVEECARTDRKWHDLLAVEKGIRLPHTKTALTTTTMSTWMHRLNLSMNWYKEWSGLTTRQEFITLNPAMNLRTFVGLLLESRLEAVH